MTAAAEILRIREKDAATLFPGDAAAVKKAFRELATKWHPDRNAEPLAGEVFAHITVLKRAALRREGGAAPAVDQERTYRTEEGKTFRFRYLSIGAGPLGDVLVGRGHLAYEIDGAFDDVAEAEVNRIGGFRFADEKMRAEMERFLPKVETTLSIPGKKVNVLKKPQDAVLLADLIAFMGGRIPAVHVAWIVSGMMNLACYLHWSGTAHGAISPSTVLVCPQFHSVILAGGWGFATEYGKRPAALPERTTSLLPRLALKGETVGPTVDLQLIRAVGQEMFASAGGGGLAMDADVPKPMRQWLIMPPLNDAWADYRGWQECLEASFGKRRFVDMGILPSDIYGN